MNILWKQCLWHFCVATSAKAAVCVPGELGSDIALSNDEQIEVLMWAYLGWDIKQGSKLFMDWL